MKKFISGVLSGVILSSAFMFAGPTTITNKNLLSVHHVGDNDKIETTMYVCYKPLDNIIKGEYSVYFVSESDDHHNESTFSEMQLELQQLKQMELFDEFKVAKELAQKLDKKNQEIEKMINDRNSKIRNIAFKMGCVTEDKIKSKRSGGTSMKDVIKDATMDDLESIESATFPNSLKEVYEAMSKELDKK